MDSSNLYDVCLLCLLEPEHRDELVELTSRMHHDPSFLLHHRASAEIVLSNILRSHGIDPRSVFLQHTPEEILGGASRFLHE